MFSLKNLCNCINSFKVKWSGLLLKRYILKRGLLLCGYLPPALDLCMKFFMCFLKRGMLGTLYLIHRENMLLFISPHIMYQQGSHCYCSLNQLSGSYDSEVNSVGQLDAKKLAASVVLYVFNIVFPAFLFITDYL